MNLILIGPEYSGTSTLAYAISKWTVNIMGERVNFHDHWKIPHVNHPPFEKTELYQAFDAWADGNGEDPTRLGFTDEEQVLFMALSSRQQEMFQRYHMDYHLSSVFYSEDHHNLVGMHIDEAVYSGMYYGYGGDGEYGDRKKYARHIEERILEQAPQSVLVLCQVSAEMIRDRMIENPHKRSVLKKKDVDSVIAKFEEEYKCSLIKNKFTVDTSSNSIDESLLEFVEKFEPFISEADRTKINSARIS